MPDTIHPELAIALFSENGTHWFDSDAPDSKRPIEWIHNEHVTKIVIGTLEREGEQPKLITAQLPDDLATLFPNLTHLYLWQIENLTALPQLPTKLECLDVRGCENLTTVPSLPNCLECLILDNCNSLTTPPNSNLISLIELSLRSCTSVSKLWIQETLRSARELRFFDGSGCSQIVNLPQSPSLKASTTNQWPESLTDLRLNQCTNLEYLGAFPSKLRRLELKHASCLSEVPSLADTNVDYLDLAHTQGLSSIPELPHRANDHGTPRPRTLFLFQTGVKLERDLYGEDDQTNVAKRYLGDLESSKAGGREEDHELKVFLLGNGRSGKSSFARRWIHGKFDPNEKSTHGVRLWEKQISFETVDSGESTAKLNIWDFAGQDLYHSTHRLFLQSRAIFIICDTDHPPGSDEATDKSEQLAIELEGEDVHRPVQYWLDQVRSLGKIPGIEQEPPVLIVRTKHDRGPQDNRDAILFSAMTGEGLKEIEQWVSKEVSKSLGTFDQRSLPSQAMEVKRELGLLIAENQKTYWEHDESPQSIVSPHPTFDLGVFKELVERKCTGIYAKNPEELLTRFHRSGFLYYNRKYLENKIILDQRWVIQGIYTFCSRQSKFHLREQLKEQRGQFTAEQLAFSWNRAGFEATSQKLFLSFMLACGMCFELLRPNESQSDESIYIAPGFLPSRSTTLRLFPDWFVDSSEQSASYKLLNTSEADIRTLISKIGEKWSRSMDAWRWGCRVSSYKTGAICVFDWARPEKDSNFTYPLVVRFDGPRDPVFERTLRDLVRECLGHAVYRSDEVLAEEWTDLYKESFPPNDRTEQESAIPPRIVGVGFKIAFSFAGSDKRRGLIGEIPKQSAEIVSNWLKENRLGEVLCYNREEGEERLDFFMRSLAKGDLTVVFLSPKYWRSKYCMAELMLVHNHKPKGRLPLKRVLVFDLDNSHLNRSDERRTLQWKKAWKRFATCRDRRADRLANGDIQEKTAILQYQGKTVQRWFELIADRIEFEKFIKMLLDYRFSKNLSIPSSKEKAKTHSIDVATQIIDRLNNPEDVVDLAAQRFDQKRDDEAALLLLHALAMKTDGKRDVRDLVKSSETEISSQFRAFVIRYLDELKDQ